MERYFITTYVRKNCIGGSFYFVRGDAGMTQKKYIHELDLDKNIFTWKNPRRIAISLKKSAEENVLRKTKPYTWAMSMLNFYIKQAGKDLDMGQKIILK